MAIVHLAIVHLAALRQGIALHETGRKVSDASSDSARDLSGEFQQDS